MATNKYVDDDEVMEVQCPIDDEAFIGRKTTARHINNSEALLSETNYKVLIELTGTADTKDRPGLDLVMVLDVSGTMKGKRRLEHLKSATKFVVEKLGPMDRLSLIKFSNRAFSLYPLSLMTPDAKFEIKTEIDKLSARGGTNITLALEKAVQVLKDRELTVGRQGAIMLMADGEPEPKDADGNQIIIGDVPVYTFGLGDDTDHQVLQNIASRSKNGTFSTIADAAGTTETSSLSVAFSQCLAGLLSIVAQDLSLTITPKKESSWIKNISAGRYQLDQIKPEAPATISFGDLYSKEIRNILVDLVLEEVTTPKKTDVLEFSYSYKDPATQKPFEALPTVITVSRNEFGATKEDPEVLVEEACQKAAVKMKEAREEADAKKYDDAKTNLDDARNILKKIDVDSTNPKMKSVAAELTQFSKYLETPETYEKLGRAFGLAAELSHELQRFGTRGDPNELRLFATEAMNIILDQVKEYENIPNSNMPMPAKDVEKIRRATATPKPTAPANDDPVKANAEEVTVCLRQAIQALQTIIEIINKK